MLAKEPVEITAEINWDIGNGSNLPNFMFYVDPLRVRLFLQYFTHRLHYITGTHLA